MMKIDSEVLISLVEERPVLWDNTLPGYKDRITTVCAWAEVCKAFKTDFDELPKRDQSDCGNFLPIFINYIFCACTRLLSMFWDLQVANVLFIKNHREPKCHSSN